MDLRRVALLTFVVGLALFLLGAAVFYASGDPVLAPTAWAGLLAAFAAAVGLILSGLIPRGKARTLRAWSIVAAGAVLVLSAPIAFFFRFKDPMIMVGGGMLLVVYAVVASVVLLRRGRVRELQGENAA